MYLKRIELHGFKSFADKSIIEFNPGITGIVGPNGCGKSNITDAIRWVMGETSVKSLRGSSMSQLIFNGSEDRKPQNLAEVTLVFDNTDKYIESEYNEIEITRRLYRQDNEAEYLLNREECRLKDIQDLIMDTGLGKNSLSIISQGNINTFAECRPEERRGIFEEAAGVSKYKKRKLESIRKLERTGENLERIGDIVFELEKQINPLKRQKEKAETYLELKEELTGIEVNVLVKEINEDKEFLDKASKTLKDLNEKQATIDADIILNEAANDEVKLKMNSLDKEVNDLQAKLIQAVNDASTLEKTKVEIDQKRKHVLNSQSKDDLESKIQSSKALLADLVDEYNDRVERLTASKEELENEKKKQSLLENDIAKTRTEIDHLVISINNSKSRKEYLVDAIENKSGYHHGVKTILNSFKNNPSVLGTLGDLLTNDEKYDTAIAVSLGSAVQFVVTKDDTSAKNCIKFLRDNKAGRATFLPISTMEPRSIRNEHKVVLDTLDGYLGVGSDFVEFDDKIADVVYNQLGNIIICDNLDNATSISKATFKRYKVVTLNGDYINVGGSLTGGSNNQKGNTLLMKRELENLKEKVASEEKHYNEARALFNKLDNQAKEHSQFYLQKQISYTKLEVEVQNKKDELLMAKSEYESLSNQNIELNDLASGKTENKMVSELNEAYKYRDSLNEEIRTKRENRMSLLNKNEELEIKLRDLRKENNSVKDSIKINSIDITKKETQMNNFLERLNEDYQMTYEYAITLEHDSIDIDKAKQDVALLRNKISSLGNVNIDSIEEYKDVSTRYDTMNTQRLDLIAAQDSILEAIKEMDEIMIDKFSSTFEAVNVEFDKVFKTLFGGGHARIKYTDPENILETGIDIDVEPPGKSIQNITLYSGGEKALIALSCLFSILKVRPVPLCILDEVEAPLDVANVERFAKYLREFSKDTQFIVVTHREGTMAECDVLYGATMQQKGVTKLVSVKLQEAKDFTSEEGVSA
ncbi:MAG: chromosome segregation protein SMC [Thomasclavelia sp.]|nr:chromosome segregation protein SMC [Thomasclavelia sp.]